MSKITLANWVIYAGGLLTGPLIARALGPDGRGQLAAILAVGSMLPVVLGVGLSAFAAREVAAGRTVSEVLRTLLPMCVVLGMIGAVAGWFLADALAEGDDTVRLFLRITFVLSPVVLFIGVLQGVLSGQQLWNRLLLARAITPAIAIVTIPALYAADMLTVASAATVMLVGGVATIVPTLGMLRQAYRARWSTTYSRSALSFGLRAWASGLANLVNLRLDQVLMITLTSDAELGLYAVAVTVATSPAVLPMAVAGPIHARVASGDRAIVARVTRTMLVIVTLLHIFVGAVANFLVPALFGAEFSSSVPMIWVLLGAGVPLAGGMLLTAALLGDGAPGQTAIAQFAALAATMPMLLTLVPDNGGMGAAIASVVAYITSFAVLSRVTITRGLATGPYDLLVPQREDLEWLRDTTQRGFRSIRSRRGQ